MTSSGGPATTAPDIEPRPAPARRGLPVGYLIVAAVLPLVLLAILGAGLIARNEGRSPTRIGAQAPTFSLVDLDGNPVDLAD